MSEQGSSTSGAAIFKDLTPPISSSVKKFRSKRGKPKINRNAKKNAKIEKITTTTKPNPIVTAVDIKANEISNLPDMMPAKKTEQTESLNSNTNQTLTQVQNIAKEEEEPATQTVNKMSEPKEVTNTEASNKNKKSEEGANLADDTVLTISKKRKRRKRKTKKNNPEIVTENHEQAIAPPAPLYRAPTPAPSVDELKMFLYSEVVKPLQKPTNPPNPVADEPGPAVPRWESPRRHEQHESASYNCDIYDFYLERFKEMGL